MWCGGVSRLICECQRLPLLLQGWKFPPHPTPPMHPPARASPKPALGVPSYGHCAARLCTLSSSSSSSPTADRAGTDITVFTKCCFLLLSMTVLLFFLYSHPLQMSFLLLLLFLGLMFTLGLNFFFFFLQRHYLTQSIASLLSKMIFSSVCFGLITQHLHSFESLHVFCNHQKLYSQQRMTLWLFRLPIPSLKSTKQLISIYSEVKSAPRTDQFSEQRVWRNFLIFENFKFL